MVEIAGLSDQVTVTVGAFADQYELLKGKTVDVRGASLSWLLLAARKVSGQEAHSLRLPSTRSCRQIYFIDHEKSVYLSDAKLILQSGTLQPGSLLIADNVLVPGAPDYLEFVETSPLFSTARHEVKLGRNGEWVDAVSVATYFGGASAI